MKVWQLIVAGVTVHMVLFYSIFDIYFTSPLVHGMTPVSSPTPTPSNRLVLFVTDGLRADKFYEQDGEGKSRTPYLREIIESDGIWGISHTRVPTESRPGHVALIAGFYEDVSAVAKGWKENPVEFDSVFNESRHTWSWGSPDILPMFAKGANGDHVTIHCYSSDLEDFAGSDMTLLDTWVFDQVKSFFASASRNLTLKKELHENKIVFFLHLLGIDTHGHSNKPHSREYLNNIKLVDKGIKEMVALIENFYGHDGATSYVVTADHGMTDWGSHGAGHAHETLTPFVAWGSGVRKPVLSNDCSIKTDTFCSDWKLQNVKRTDVEQADIAPLMSYLVGIPFPLNSVGTLPVDVLSASDAVKAEALLANAKQILAQFEVKMNQIKDRTIAVTFRPFQELIEAEKLQSLRHIRNLIHNGQFQDSIHESNLLIQKALRGLRYYQTYDRFFLGVSIVLAFLGWMFYILYLVVLEHTAVGQAYTSSLIRSRQSSIGLYLFFAIGICVTILLYAQSLSLMCYVYCLLPVVLWYKASQGLSLLYEAVQSAAEKNSLRGLALSVLFCIAGLEIIIQSFHHRELLSLGLLAMSAWPLVIYKSNKLIKSDIITYVGWSLSCIIVSVFPLMPVVGGQTRYSLVLTSGILATIGGVFIFTRLPKHYSGLYKYSLVFQLFLVGLCVIIVKTTSDSIEQKLGLPLLCQVCSVAVLGFSTFLPLFSPTSLEGRLFSLTLSFMAPYLLLSITYEGYFFLSLLSLLYFWLRMEYSISERSDLHFWQVDFRYGGLVKDNIPSANFFRYLELSDLRRAFFFIFLNLTAFFGTGNIASINSFDPASVYCFLTVFNPFLMGTLMMLKIIIPFLEVTCVFRAVHVLTRTPLRSLFLIVLIMSDFMGLHFFFLVRDYGSWLEIGTTISHYVIVMLMILFLLVFTGASHALTCWHLSTFSQKKRGSV